MRLFGKIKSRLSFPSLWQHFSSFKCCCNSIKNVRKFLFCIPMTIPVENWKMLPLRQNIKMGSFKRVRSDIGTPICSELRLDLCLYPSSLVGNIQVVTKPNTPEVFIIMKLVPVNFSRTISQCQLCLVRTIHRRSLTSTSCFLRPIGILKNCCKVHNSKWHYRISATDCHSMHSIVRRTVLCSLIKVIYGRNGALLSVFFSK